MVPSAVLLTKRRNKEIEENSEKVCFLLFLRQKSGISLSVLYTKVKEDNSDVSKTKRTLKREKESVFLFRKQT